MHGLTGVPSASSEFESAELGDRRLTRRLLRLAEALASAPGDSLPRAAGSDGELEGVYRFFGNSRVSLESIVAPHLSATDARCGEDAIYAVHDTTSFAFRGGGHRDGLGFLQRSGSAQSKDGFFGHFTLAVSADGSRCPLGLLDVSTFVRTGEPLTKAITGRRRTNRPVKESARWIEQVLRIHARLPHAIHVMDREADAYETYRLMVAANARFVIRGRIGWNRRAKRADLEGTIPELAAMTPIRLRKTVQLSRRAPNRVSVLNKAHPPRDERAAKLVVRALQAELPRPDHFSRRDPARGPLSLNVVLVEEEAPPNGVEPVAWLLMTTEPIRTKDEIERVVDAYRCRWQIEEFFKALKSGCNFEKRQLESLPALRNALGVFSVIAWRLLLLRTFARAAPDASATAVATRKQLAVLRSLQHVPDSRVSSIRLPVRANAGDVLAAVAKLGGHLPRNGPPGWQVLGRGYDALLLLEMGWRARDAM